MNTDEKIKDNQPLSGPAQIQPLSGSGPWPWSALIIKSIQSNNDNKHNIITSIYSLCVEIVHTDGADYVCTEYCLKTFKIKESLFKTTSFLVFYRRFVLLLFM